MTTDSRVLFEQTRHGSLLYVKFQVKVKQRVVVWCLPYSTTIAITIAFAVESPRRPSLCASMPSSPTSNLHNTSTVPFFEDEIVVDISRRTLRSNTRITPRPALFVCRFTVWKQWNSLLPVCSQTRHRLHPRPRAWPDSSASCFCSPVMIGRQHRCWWTRRES